MNAQLENKVSMYYKVREFYSNNLATLNPFAPALTTQTTTFLSQLSNLDALLILSSETTTGYAIQKQNIRTALSELGLAVSGALYAFAKSNNNEPLAEKVYTTKTALNSLRDTDLLYWCQRISPLATTNAAAIVPYGITAVKLTAYNNTLTQYSNSIQEPADKRSEGKAALQEAENAIITIDNTLNNIDAVMLAIKSDKPLLYAQYKADRLIDDNASGNSIPDISIEIGAGETKMIFNIAYLDSRQFKIKNKGADSIEWAISDDSNTPNFPYQTVPANGFSVKLSATLGPSGDYLFVFNPSSNTIPIELTIIE